jgi:hypothetical protein
MVAMPDIRPFRIDVPDDDLADLRRRLAAAVPETAAQTIGATDRLGSPRGRRQ